MAKFLTHDAIASGVFNKDTCTATSTMAQWQSELLNSKSTLNLLCDRLASDYSSLGPKMRKPFGAKDVDARYQLHCSNYIPFHTPHFL